ncbi:Sec-independent protein translocase TatC [Anaerovirgula multivorans]|uniref:Sec-independent protein translocase protein TatC n=1 Tax=Anaerovirgula multivorans TaxID=312168 RepID=A0A239AUB4_9FIRM|nr:twin-arginine translocase subunit TatC [Anaerovirgula multivorans]SNR99207.1 Sec-independent protein translocase TatC [Anaerovirgula multivorans]
MQEDMKQTIVEHLTELRKRIIISVLAVIITSVLSYIYIDTLLDFIVQPASGLEFIYLSPPELFLAYLEISFITGMILASPVILLQIWIFIKPGLKKHERKYLLFALFMGMIFFLIGASFAYYMVIPLAINFFVAMSVQQIEPLFSFANYIRFISSLLLSFGLVFQLPLFIILLSQLNLITPKTLKKYRKFVVLLIFVVAAILTPPDIVSQVLMAGPMLVLYEFSVIISSIIYRRKRKKAVEG